MSHAILEQQIRNLLRIHAPIKARQLAKILSDEFGEHVDRSDVNSALYRLKSSGQTKKNAKYQWRLTNTPPPPPPTDPEISFTPEQEAIIKLDPSNHLLVRGQAGSGKTTVLAARAGHILSAMNKGSLLFLTYNAALCAYVKKAFKQAGMKGSIDVRTFHKWTRHAIKDLGYTFRGWVDAKKRAEKIKEFIVEAQHEVGAHRLYDLETSPHLIDWWGDEIAWLFGQHITRLEEYRSVERRDRGTAVRLTRDDRTFVWPVYELYQEWLEESGQEDYDNPAGLLLRVLEEKNRDLPETLRYDHLMIDEVQDFDKSWLLAAVKIPRVSLSLAGDLAQKIYRRSFSWSSVGIQVQGGRSRKLGGSFRTTAQIMEVAIQLLEGDQTTTDDDATPIIMPTKQGDKVRLLIGSDPRRAYDDGYQYVADHFKRLRKTSVVVALPFSRQLYPAQKALESRRVKVTRAKGSNLGNFEGGVVVTTFHQLKGLEFDHVVIMGLHDAQYPGRLFERVPEEDREDEAYILKRVLYMAMTRAKISVTLVGSEPFCRFFGVIPRELFEAI